MFKQIVNYLPHIANIFFIETISYTSHLASQFNNRIVLEVYVYVYVFIEIV